MREALSRSSTFKLTVFLDADYRFLEYTTPWAAENVQRGQKFAEVNNQGRAELFSHPGVVRKTVSTRSTNAEALREMIEKKGSAEREQVLSRMMLALTR